MTARVRARMHSFCLREFFWCARTHTNTCVREHTRARILCARRAAALRPPLSRSLSLSLALCLCLSLSLSFSLSLSLSLSLPLSPSLSLSLSPSTHTHTHTHTRRVLRLFGRLASLSLTHTHAGCCGSSAASPPSARSSRPSPPPSSPVTTPPPQSPSPRALRGPCWPWPVCVRACVRACMHACVRVCARAPRGEQSPRRALRPRSRRRGPSESDSGAAAVSGPDANYYLII